MRTQKSKYTVHYNLGLTFILLMFVYIWFTHPDDYKKLLTADFIFLFIAGIGFAIRAFLADRLQRVSNGEDKVNFWKYLDETDRWTLGANYFKITPIFKSYNDKLQKKIKFEVNFTTVIIYLALIGFICTLMSGR